MQLHFHYRSWCGLAFAAAICAAISWNGAWAQTTTPSPSPSPTPQFHSPFNGDREAKGPEATDFNNLMDLYDAMKDAEAALKTAETCKGDVAAAKKALDAATTTFENAMATYINDWSNKTYGIPPGTKVTPQRLGKGSKYFSDNWNEDSKKVLDELAKQDKKQHVAGKCPVKEEKADVSPSPPPKPQPQPGLRTEGRSYFQTPGLMGARVSLDYSHFEPSSGTGGDQFGGSLDTMIGLVDKFGLNLGGEYHNVSSSGPSLDSWYLKASGVWWTGDLRLGPTFGYQSNSTGKFYDSQIYNYGGYVDYYPLPHLTLSAKAGGFSGSYKSDGYYLGGRFTEYPLPDFAVSGKFDDTHFSPYGGSNEYDYGLDFEYMFRDYDDEDDDDCWWPPTSIEAGYDFTEFSNSDFHVSTYFVQFNVYTNGTGAAHLEDFQRTSTTGWSSAFSPLTYRF